MPSDIEGYRGFQIVWDVRSVKATGLWKGQAAVVLPPDICGINYVHGISGDAEYFTSRDEARACLLRRGREWIDNRLERESRARRDIGHDHIVTPTRAP
jgi:hypothetical protein